MVVEQYTKKVGKNTQLFSFLILEQIQWEEQIKSKGDLSFSQSVTNPWNLALDT